MEREKVLVLWSGGIDSTAVLKLYLENSDYEVIAHHVDYMVGLGLRQKKEADSISKLLPKLKSIRNFTYVETYCDYSEFPKFADVPMVFTLSIPIAIKFNCEKIVVGFVSDARENQPAYIAKNKRHLDIISESLCALNNVKKIPRLHSSEFFNNKLNYIISLGDLIDDVWYCRGYIDDKTKKRVLTNKPCGKCDTCKHVDRSLDALLNICVDKNDEDKIINNIYESNKEEIVLGVGYD